MKNEDRTMVYLDIKGGNVVDVTVHGPDNLLEIYVNDYDNHPADTKRIYTSPGEDDLFIGATFINMTNEKMVVRYIGDGIVKVDPGHFEPYRVMSIAQAISLIKAKLWKPGVKR